MCAADERTAGEKAPRTSVGVAFALGLIKLYTYTFKAFTGPSCRYVPSCSGYAADALTRFGLWPGLWMTLARVVRCHPWGSFGLDPVPEHLPPDSCWYMPWRYGRWRHYGAPR